ncbi:MAG: glycosyl transferase [Bacteroidetes bacterium]|nr:MAG: glycosyl transferase [Bacteroidota bacterium]
MEDTITGKLKIAYIGGDTSTIELLKTHDAFEISDFGNSLLFVNWLNNGNEPDGILCESFLPGTNGIEFHQYLGKKNLATEVPFILVSRHEDEKIRKSAISHKVDDLYLTPLNPENIETRIRFLRDHKELLSSKQETAEQFRDYSIPLIKRLFDIAVAGMALIFLSPFLLVIMFAIWAESGFKGKVYYISKRVGTGYKIFDFYKLRSMSLNADKMLKSMAHLNQYEAEKIEDKCPDCESLGHPCSTLLIIEGDEICEKHYMRMRQVKINQSFIKIKDDPRITKVGAFIRNTSIDELPQLINVLKGDMSIVGNRPLPLYEAELLTSDEWGERFLGPAGITGLWQVELRGKQDMSIEERKTLDNVYARNYSFWGDIKLILRTIPALLQKENV